MEADIGGAPTFNACFHPANHAWRSCLPSRSFGFFMGTRSKDRASGGRVVHVIYSHEQLHLGRLL